MTPTLYANDELVTVAWLALVFDSTDMVGLTLPQDQTKWSASGFVQPSSFPGGSSDMYVPMYSPVVQVDCWAVTPTSGKPAWGKAANLAQAIENATYGTAFREKTLTLPGSFPPAQLKTVYLNTRPHRVPDDPSGFARFMLELRINWAPVSL